MFLPPIARRVLESQFQLLEHYGPGDHPSGSPQEAHAGADRAPAGGWTNYYNGEFYKGGQWMPSAPGAMPKGSGNKVRAAIRRTTVAVSDDQNIASLRIHKSGTGSVVKLRLAGEERERTSFIGTDDEATMFVRELVKLRADRNQAAGFKIHPTDILDERARVQEHYGPGAHPGTGSPQSVHGGGWRGDAPRWGDGYAAPGGAEVGNYRRVGGEGSLEGDGGEALPGGKWGDWEGAFSSSAGLPIPGHPLGRLSSTGKPLRQPMGPTSAIPIMRRYKTATAARRAVQAELLSLDPSEPERGYLVEGRTVVAMWQGNMATVPARELSANEGSPFWLERAAAGGLTLYHNHPTTYTNGLSDGDIEWSWRTGVSIAELSSHEQAGWHYTPPRTRDETNSAFVMSAYDGAYEAIQWHLQKSFLSQEPGKFFHSLDARQQKQIRDLIPNIQMEQIALDLEHQGNLGTIVPIGDWRKGQDNAARFADLLHKETGYQGAKRKRVKEATPKKRGDFPDDAEFFERLRRLRPRRVREHYGPGAHPGTGTPQSVHGSGRTARPGSGRTARPSVSENVMHGRRRAPGTAGASTVEQDPDALVKGGWHQAVNPKGLEGFVGTLPAPKGAYSIRREIDASLVRFKDASPGKPVWLGMKFKTQALALKAADAALSALEPEVREMAYVVRDGVIQFATVGERSYVSVGGTEDGWTEGMMDLFPGSTLTHLHPSGTGGLSLGDMTFATAWGAKIRTAVSNQEADASAPWEYTPTTFGRERPFLGMGQEPIRAAQSNLFELERIDSGIDESISRAVRASGYQTRQASIGEYMPEEHARLMKLAHSALASRMTAGSRAARKFGRLRRIGPARGLTFKEAFTRMHGQTAGEERFGIFRDLLRETIIPSMRNGLELDIPIPLVESAVKLISGIDDREYERRMRRYYPVRKQRRVREHYGPGAHPGTGTPQSVHGSGRTPRPGGAPQMRSDGRFDANGAADAQMEKEVARIRKDFGAFEKKYGFLPGELQKLWQREDRQLGRKRDWEEYKAVLGAELEGLKADDLAGRFGPPPGEGLKEPKEKRLFRVDPKWPPDAGKKAGTGGDPSANNENGLEIREHSDGTKSIRKRLKHSDEPAASSFGEILFGRLARRLGDGADGFRAFGRVQVNGASVISEMRRNASGLYVLEGHGAADKPVDEKTFEDMQLISFVDHVLNNQDRHSGNAMVVYEEKPEGGFRMRVAAIDHDLYGPARQWTPGWGSGQRAVGSWLFRTFGKYPEKGGSIVMTDRNSYEGARVKTPKGAKPFKDFDDFKGTLFKDSPFPQEPRNRRLYEQFMHHAFDRYQEALERGWFPLEGRSNEGDEYEDEE